MDNKIKNIINLDQIYCTTIKAKQKIDQEYLFDFIQTNLQLYDYNCFYTYYSANATIYSIIAINSSNSKNIILEPQFLTSLCNSSLLSYHLFILDNYFALFYKKELVYCKNIDGLKKADDIKQYIQHIFNIEKLDVTFIDKTQYENLKNSIDDIKPYNYIDKKSSGFIKKIYYKIYIVAIFLFVFGYIFYKYQNIQKQNSINMVSKKQYELFLKQNINKQYLIKRLKFYFDEVAKNRIKIKKATIKNNKISLQIVSKQKQNIYNFVDKIRSQNPKLKYIMNDIQTNSYESRIDFEIY